MSETVLFPSGRAGIPSGSTAGPLTRTVTGRRRVAEFLSTSVVWLSFAIAVVPLFLVVAYVTGKGVGQLSWSFLTEGIPRQYRKVGPGMGPAIVGTLLTTGMASLLAIPLGVMGAVYLNEYGKTSRPAAALRLLADVMTGVPSIVMGLFIYTIWVLRFESQTTFAGALALGALMLPIVIRSSEEMLRLVPNDLREGSAALGAYQWQTIVRVVLPAALPGITSGAMLAVARAAGETAPLLFTIGIVYRSSWDVFGPNTALSAQIFRNASQPFAGSIDRAWGAAFTLVVMVFTLTVLARVFIKRFTIEETS